jgi:hypothetical protein
LSYLKCPQIIVLSEMEAHFLINVYFTICRRDVPGFFSSLNLME